MLGRVVAYIQDQMAARIPTEVFIQVPAGGCIVDRAEAYILVQAEGSTQGQVAVCTLVRAVACMPVRVAVFTRNPAMSPTTATSLGAKYFFDT